MCRLSRLRKDRSGVTAVEFALVAPIMIVMIMGFIEVIYQGYVQSSLAGMVQAAGRSGTIQGATAATIDNTLLTGMKSINASMAFSTGYPKRLSYHDFGDVGPEVFVDTNVNGVRDAGECFTDVNANGAWDADPGTSGQGGASDVVVYTVSMTYPRIMPVAAWLGWSGTATVTAATIFKSQPYASQASATDTTVCT